MIRDEHAIGFYTNTGVDKGFPPLVVKEKFEFSGCNYPDSLEFIEYQ